MKKIAIIANKLNAGIDSGKCNTNILGSIVIEDCKMDTDLINIPIPTITYAKYQKNSKRKVNNADYSETNKLVWTY